MLKDQIVRGSSIIFQRYAERKKSYIRNYDMETKGSRQEVNKTDLINKEHYQRVLNEKKTQAET